MGIPRSVTFVESAAKQLQSWRCEATTLYSYSRARDDPELVRCKRRGACGWLGAGSACKRTTDYGERGVKYVGGGMRVCFLVRLVARGWCTGCAMVHKTRLSHM